MPYNPKELMKKILAGSDFKLKGSVKGRVRVASRDGAIVNFTAADFGVQSLNDKISLVASSSSVLELEFLGF